MAMLRLLKCHDAGWLRVKGDDIISGLLPLTLIRYGHHTEQDNGSAPPPWDVFSVSYLDAHELEHWSS
jgi:hypothetical protein